VTLEAEGVGQSATGTAQDRAGNTATAAVAGINIDRTAPTIAASRTPANTNGWSSGDVTVTFSCADALSGLASCSAPVVLSAEGAAQSASGSARDPAGNTASAVVSGIDIDRTAPTIVGTPTAANVNGWSNDDVVVTFACADALSGVESCGATAVIVDEGAGLSVSRGATDRAGNASTATVAGVNIDRTEPTIAFSGNASAYEVDHTVAITCAATDALSGVATTTCPAVASAPAYSFVTANPTVVTRTATATDLAGNTTSASTSFTVTVTYSGVCALTGSFSTSATVGESLCAQLSAAAMADSRGSEIAKGNAIASYQNEVQAQVGRAFTSAQAATLISLSKLL